MHYAEAFMKFVFDLIFYQTLWILNNSYKIFHAEILSLTLKFYKFLQEILQKMAEFYKLNLKFG